MSEIVNDAPILALKSDELTAISSVVALTCLEQSNKYTEAKLNKIDPKYLNNERKDLLSCTLNTYSCAKDECAEELDTLKACLNRGRWAKCKDLTTALQKCALKKKCGA